MREQSKYMISLYNNKWWKKWHFLWSEENAWEKKAESKIFPWKWLLPCVEFCEWVKACRMLCHDIRIAYGEYVIFSEWKISCALSPQYLSHCFVPMTMDVANAWCFDFLLCPMEMLKSSGARLTWWMTSIGIG